MRQGAGMGISWRSRLLLTTSVLFAVAGCDVSVPAHGTASPTPSEVAPPPAPANAATATPDASKRGALLNGLRQAGVPVSADGELEVRAADVACEMIGRGMTSEDLATAVAARFAIPAPRAQRALEVVIRTYC